MFTLLVEEEVLVIALDLEIFELVEKVEEVLVEMVLLVQMLQPILEEAAVVPQAQQEMMVEMVEKDV